MQLLSWARRCRCVLIGLLVASLAACAQMPGGTLPLGVDAASTTASGTQDSPAFGLLDDTPRIAVMSAFAPELALLRQRLQNPQSYMVNGVEFTTGVLESHPVVLLLSGISMVNASMNTQLLFDRFQVTHLVFSGIAGGVNPSLHLGDVSVPQRWGQYLEVVMMRETAPGQYQAPASKGKFQFAPYGMMQPRDVRVRRAGQPEFQEKFWFEADPRMLEVARSIQHVPLKSCDAQGQCVRQAPRLVVGGNGVSGQAFVDNAAYRRYAYDTFQANVLDMESAACAMVADANGIPFIAFRSLSDLAGGGSGENEMHVFLQIAADNAAHVLLAFLQAWPVAGK
ncbi:5'-methylthioadenosine/S-adenosylhomocysteine nucleosidase [Castellaniella sp.]|uniref:5'-methylthioadenosine/S-adenosylhomocysteine nucleosidase n=1 Tax=Castellaniella sp. TaxID=1955812 RepID=UPI002AFFC968|nr:5'-methylthioadenosine/S-adenosylhomocysteine nucleosidase [Castellaniella sp.]